MSVGTMGDDRVYGTAQAVPSEKQFISFDAPRPADDVISDLALQFDEICAQATGPLQIAAALEASGINDKAARERYAHIDVFALAETMYERVPLKVASFEPREEIDPDPAWRELSRGVLFVLPGALYAVAFQNFSSGAAAYALLASLIFAWVWGQGSGYLGHMLIGRRADGSARRLVLRMSVVGIMVAAAASWAIAYGNNISAEIIAVSIIQTTYLLAAGVLLLFRKEFVLLAVLLPGSATALVILFVDLPFAEWIAVNAAISLTVAAAAVTAIVATRGVTNVNPGSLSVRDVMGAAPHMAVGLTWASLVSLSVLVMITGRSNEPLLGLTIVPLLLSMGVAEWSLRHYLRTSRQELQKINDPAHFASAARVATWKTVAGYTAMLAAITAAAASLMYFFWSLTLGDGLMLISYTLLGAAFLLGQMLTSRSRSAEVLFISIASLTILFSLLSHMGLDALAAAYVYSTMFLAMGLLIRSLMTAGHVTAYR